MKRTAVLGFLLFFIFSSNIYAAEVKNVTTKQVGNRMIFEYDLVGETITLNGKGQTVLIEDDLTDAEVNVTLTVKGQSYPMEKLHLEGDFGRVKPGKAKKIWWNVLQDFPRGYSGNIDWEITILDSIIGVWKGAINQPGSRAYSGVMVINNLNKGSIIGSMDYPELDCGGSLTLIDNAPKKYVIKEKMKYGFGKCVDNGTIKLDLKNSELIWIWYYPDGKRGAQSSMRKEK